LTTAALKAIFTGKIVVILAEPLDPQTRALRLQDYRRGETSFIPVFTSLEKLRQSTGGADLGRPVIEMDGLLFASLMNGSETIVVNPALEEAVEVSAADLRSALRAEVEQSPFRRGSQP
jgi:hypothetical protein